MLATSDEDKEANRVGRRRVWEGVTSLLERHQSAKMFLVNLVMTMAVHLVGVVVDKLIVTPYLARNLDEAALGAWLLGRNVTALLAGGIYSGIYNLLLRRNAEWSDEEKPAIVFSAGVLSLGLSAGVFVLALIVMAAQSGNDFVWRHWLPILAFGVWGACLTLTYVVQTFWRMQLRLLLFNALQLILVLTLLIVIPAYIWGGLRGVYWGWMVVGIAPLLATLWLGAREIAGRDVRLWRADAARQMLRRMWVFVWGTVSLALLQNTDRFVVGWLLGTAAVGTYFKSTSVAYMIVVPLEPLAGLLLSMAAQERTGAHTRGHYLRLHALILTLMVGLLLVGFSLGRPITDWLYGAGTFATGRQLYAIVLVGCAFSIIPILLRGVLIVHVPTKWILWHDSLSVALLAVAGLVLTAFYGLTGAAVAVAGAMVLRAMLSEAAVVLTLRRNWAAR